jgi:hypothetical protein
MDLVTGWAGPSPPGGVTKQEGIAASGLRVIDVPSLIYLAGDGTSIVLEGMAGCPIQGLDSDLGD